MKNPRWQVIMVKKITWKSYTLYNLHDENVYFQSTSIQLWVNHNFSMSQHILSLSIYDVEKCLYMREKKEAPIQKSKNFQHENLCKFICGNKRERDMMWCFFHEAFLHVFLLRDSIPPLFIDLLPMVLFSTSHTPRRKSGKKASARWAKVAKFLLEKFHFLPFSALFFCISVLREHFIWNVENVKVAS